jgi:clan AA aspartic protease (TIGR02281 family)
VRSRLATYLFSLWLAAPIHGAVAQSRASSPCLTTGQIVSGKLVIERATHPGNGMQLSAYVLQLPSTTCAVDSIYGRATYDVRKIHLINRDGDPLRKLVGQTITVRLDSLEPSMTAYHFGNAISDKYALTTGAMGATSAAASPPGVIEVQMIRNGGTYAVPVLINNAITLDFVLDSGASDVSIPSDVFGTLVRAGTITKEDIIGSDTYTLADGSQKTSTTFRIRSLKIGPTVLENVKGSVAEDSGPLLLGMSFLSRFKSWSVDNERHVLALK